MNIEPLRNQIVSEIKKRKDIKRLDNAGKSNPLSSIKDTSKVSQNGKLLSATKGNNQVISAHVVATNDIRQDKIDEVRLKKEHGFYDSKEFIDKLADKMMSLFGFQES